MDQNSSKKHWENIYTTRHWQDASWFQAVPEISLKLIEKLGDNKAQILDVGGGASRLVDCLLERGFCKLGVLDISGTVIDLVKKRLGEQAQKIEWYKNDIREFKPLHTYDIWHDRAVFHFLLDEKSQVSYVEALKNSVKKNGHVIIATFAQDGPKKCSGLDIIQYDNQSIKISLGDDFKLLNSERELHITPTGNKQNFVYFIFQRL